MQLNHSSRARWFVACALALGALGVCARGSAAPPNQLMYVDVISTNAGCLSDANGNPYAAQGLGFNSSGQLVCDVGALATSTGSSAEAQCNLTSPATTQTLMVSPFQTSTGSLLGPHVVCATTSPAAWGTEQECSGPAIVTSTCPSGNTITGIAEGMTFASH
jgi:hypothetical protein